MTISLSTIYNYQSKNCIRIGIGSAVRDDGEKANKEKKRILKNDFKIKKFEL
jgi:hypothetical protein